jgi:hypothetical protein
MKSGEPRRRAVARAFWRIVNPVTRPAAGLVPWWVILETKGRRSGKPRPVPLARGPVDGHIAWLISVHGETAWFARNIDAWHRAPTRPCCPGRLSVPGNRLGPTGVNAAAFERVIHSAHVAPVSSSA